ncbi:WecB/TagA/CpsF family glycosyltransferase [Maribellus sediminis]|uniref:WecB/TagA/CpsF family glycosyltransferase n=1 Tax=Maribellus sediminis TaxID=2696285 RepID=UPI001431CC68|nr:WecB/TagA/CpsF family glycosyltransferase [Maribellus sediminis]
MLKDYKLFENQLKSLSSKKTLISTINAHSYNTALADNEFSTALQNSDVLIPDGISVVWAIRRLTGQKLKKIAGADLFFYEMERLATSHKPQAARPGRVFFLGSTEETLEKIKTRAAKEYPNVEVGAYSPPYKPEFSEEDNKAMIEAVNTFQPDVLFVGMTAPKQEKWAYHHFQQLEVGHVCCIGAVFDFYAGTVKRAPQWMIKLGLEWFYRLVKEPKRMWRRYLVGNTKFIYYVVREKLCGKKRISNVD